MNSLFHKILDRWMRVGMVLGNFISTVFLFVFYYTVFALFALPFRIFSRAGRATGDFNYHLPEKQMDSLDNFRKEF